MKVESRKVASLSYNRNMQPQFEFVVFISLLALLVWAFCFGSSFRYRQTSIGALFMLMTLMAIAWSVAKWLQ